MAAQREGHGRHSRRADVRTARLTDAAQSLLGSVGADQAHLQRTLTEAKRLIATVRDSIGAGESPNLPG